MRSRRMERRLKLTQALLQVPPQTRMQRNCHWVNHYAQQCELRMVYPQRYLTTYGPTQVGGRETSRSELWNLLCDTPGSNNLSHTLQNLHTIPIPDLRDDDMWHEICRLSRLLLQRNLDMDSLSDIASISNPAHNMHRNYLWCHDSSYLLLEAVLESKR